MREKIASAVEGIVIVAIILVLVQTFLEDFGVLAGWEWSVRRVFIFSGFIFDLFFTIEFLVRMYTAVYQGKGREYFTQRRGWIDFVASVPLLLLSSGPAVLAVVTGGTMMFAVGSILNVLKVVKAVRIARILRLLRVLKVFKQIKYTDSVMAQRHVAKITTMTVTLFVFVVLLASIVIGLAGGPSIEDIVSRRNQDVADLVEAADMELDAVIEAVAGINDDLLIVKMDGETRYSRYDNEYYAAKFGPSDYEYLEFGSFSFYFDYRTANELQAKDNIVFFSIIVLLVALLLVYYSPHFALTVTDPIHVMRKGLDDPSYNFEVKIPRRYHDDDIYRLAQSYNSEYLPLKDRSQDTVEAQTSLLDFDDVKGLLDEE